MDTLTVQVFSRGPWLCSVEEEQRRLSPSQLTYRRNGRVKYDPQNFRTCNPVCSEILPCLVCIPGFSYKSPGVRILHDGFADSFRNGSAATILLVRPPPLQPRKAAIMAAVNRSATPSFESTPPGVSKPKSSHLMKHHVMFQY